MLQPHPACLFACLYVCFSKVSPVLSPWKVLLTFCSLCLNHSPHPQSSQSVFSHRKISVKIDWFSVLHQLLLPPSPFLSTATLTPTRANFPPRHWAETGSLFCDQDGTLFVAYIRWSIIVGQINEWMPSRMNDASLWSRTSKNLTPLKTLESVIVEKQCCLCSIQDC